MSYGAYWHVSVYFVTGLVRTKISGVRYRVNWISYPERKDGTKTSSCVKLYKSVEGNYENTPEVAIDYIICNYMNVYLWIFLSIFHMGSILLLFVQRFDYIDKSCHGIFSQSDLQNMDVQSWWYALNFIWVLMKTFSIHHGVIPWTIESLSWNISILLLVFQGFSHMEKSCLGICSQSDLQNMDAQRRD